MLTERTGQLIVVLLAAILAVLVFGREAVIPYLTWSGIALLALVVVDVLPANWTGLK